MTDTTNPWIWEYCTRDGITVYDVTEYADAARTLYLLTGREPVKEQR